MKTIQTYVQFYPKQDEIKENFQQTNIDPLFCSIFSSSGEKLDRLKVSVVET
jgi:hypothetical protein